MIAHIRFVAVPFELELLDNDPDVDGEAVITVAGANVGEDNGSEANSRANVVIGLSSGDRFEIVGSPLTIRSLFIIREEVAASWNVVDCSVTTSIISCEI